MDTARDERVTVWTVGHGAKPADVLAELVESYGITALLDCRYRPFSGRFPQFNREALRDAFPRRSGDDNPYFGRGHAIYTPVGEILGNARRFGASPADRPTYEAFLEFAIVRASRAGERVMLLCAEGHFQSCHRHDPISLDLLKFPDVRIVHTNSKEGRLLETAFDDYEDALAAARPAPILPKVRKKALEPELEPALMLAL